MGESFVSSNKAIISHAIDWFQKWTWHSVRHKTQGLASQRYIFLYLLIRSLFFEKPSWKTCVSRTAMGLRLQTQRQLLWQNGDRSKWTAWHHHFATLPTLDAMWIIIPIAQPCQQRVLLAPSTCGMLSVCNAYNRHTTAHCSFHIVHQAPVKNSN
jgi:hypothetical protein